MQKQYYDVMKVLRNIYGKDAQTNFDLDYIGKKLFGNRYKGSHSYESFKNINGYQILNTDPKNKPGVHWIAVYKNKNIIYVYDSFGRKTKNILKKFYATVNPRFNIIESKNDPEQAASQKDCGLRCMAWLFIVDNMSIDQALEI